MMILEDEIKTALKLKLLSVIPILEDEEREYLEQLFDNEVEQRDYVRKKLFPRVAA